MQKANIRRVQYHTPTARYKLWFVTDLHIGAATCREDLIHRDVAAIAADPNARVILGGDLIEAIKPDDKRFDAATTADWITKADLKRITEAQVERTLDILAPIADKVDAVLCGNHEAKVPATYHDLVAGIGDAAGIAPKDNDLGLGVGGYLYYKWDRMADGKPRTTTTTVRVHHGHGGAGRTHANPVNKLARAMESHDCDLLIMGHIHTFARVETRRNSINKRTGQIETRVARGYFIPAYLESHIDKKPGQLIHPDTYIERADFAPVPIGCVPIVIEARNSGTPRIYTEA